MKLSDYVARFLSANGVGHVFGLQGGAVVHLFDSVATTPGIEAVYCHHEQAAALAATSYAKVGCAVGACIVTTGPAATNAITGLLAAWQDSVPVIFISGQTRIEHTSYGKPVRQVGSQEVNILDIIKPISKYAALVRTPDELPAIMERALMCALDARPGPVWIDLPVSLQWAEIDAADPKRIEVVRKKHLHADPQIFQPVLDALKVARRPVMIAGYGIRSAGCAADFAEFAAESRIPFVSTWTASDLTDADNPLFGGIIGLNGQRGANKILYEADLILCLGTHLSSTQTGTLFNQFAPMAKKAIINIDQGELDNLNIAFDIKILGDIRDFFACVPCHSKISFDRDWVASVGAFKTMNSVEATLLEKSTVGDDEVINSNYFNNALSRRLPERSHLVVDGGGTALYAGFQSAALKRGQRIICSSAISAMGTGLPESVGVAFADPQAQIYCLVGDGSLMLNLQELQTIRHHDLPVKVIIFNNNGYLAIRHTQKSFLGGRYWGTDPEHGVSLPAIKNIAACFDFDYINVRGVHAMDKAIENIVAAKGRLIAEVIVSPEQATLFQQGFREVEPGRYQPMPLSEMGPYIQGSVN